MSDFISAMTTEISARRKRLRGALGDRGQGLLAMLIMGGVILGSLGLFLAPWMPGAAPWGFTLPFIYVAGYLLIELRRQRSGALVRAEDAEEAERAAIGYDWMAVLWGLSCALAGAAAFVIAWNARPAPPPEPDFWTPPETSVESEFDPVRQGE